MRSLSDEFRGGTFEILRTIPLSTREVVGGKYLASLAVMALTLLPTFIYFYSIQHLSSQGGLDVGGTFGSYIGLFFLVAVFVSMGLCCSSFTNNAVVSFIVSVFVCFVLEHLTRPVEALALLHRLLEPGGTMTVIEGDHGSTYFHPDSAAARRVIVCQVELQRSGGGDALISGDSIH